MSQTAAQETRKVGVLPETINGKFRPCQLSKANAATPLSSHSPFSACPPTTPKNPTDNDDLVLQSLTHNTDPNFP